MNVIQSRLAMQYKDPDDRKNQAGARLALYAQTLVPSDVSSLSWRSPYTPRSSWNILSRRPRISGDRDRTPSVRDRTDSLRIYVSCRKAKVLSSRTERICGRMTI